jgi:hypothetical protein
LIRRSLAIAFLVMSCAPKPIVLNEGSFDASRKPGAEVLASVFPASAYADGITGSARIQASSPEFTERGAMDFATDRTRSLATLRNTLGIEGYRILIEPDSTTVYNRIDRIAQRFATDEALFSFPLLEIMNPDFRVKTLARLYENETYWYFRFADGSGAIVTKKSGLLKRYDALGATFLYEDVRPVRGVPMARRIQWLSADKKSNIFLNIQAVEINPSTMEFDLVLPEGTRIQRP